MGGIEVSLNGLVKNFKIFMLLVKLFVMVFMEQNRLVSNSLLEGLVFQELQLINL